MLFTSSSKQRSLFLKFSVFFLIGIRFTDLEEGLFCLKFFITKSVLVKFTVLVKEFKNLPYEKFGIFAAFNFTLQA